jgi:uncharacterized membrane protein YsdA (DUF1294 family)
MKKIADSAAFGIDKTKAPKKANRVSKFELCMTIPP